MRVHFISIGGAIMHNLAIALKEKGYAVSGSDDEIFDPAKSRLDAHGLLPKEKGWFPSKITRETDAIILGMHAKKDNPELLKAQQLGTKIYSFPEFVFLNSTDKIRVAIAGSHGKTTITSMIMHVLRKAGYDFDYMVGSSVKGFEHSFRLTEKARYIILEADEYLSSALNPEPKFLWYKPQIAVISGIAWDHANVFPTYEIYKEQFRKFIASMPSSASLFYHADDKDLSELVKEGEHINKTGYSYPDYSLKNGGFVLHHAHDKETSLHINGKHNLLNVESARLVCESLGIDNDTFYEAISDFEGAGKRLERIYEKNNFIIFRDFAHAPSKVKATISGVREQFPDKRIVACLELHTYSSLNRTFLPEYRSSTEDADIILVYIDKKAVELKSMELLSEDEVQHFFNDKRIKVLYSTDSLINTLQNQKMDNSVLLMMSSGNFGNLDIQQTFEIR